MIKPEDIQKAKDALNDFYTDTEQMATLLPPKDRVHAWQDNFEILMKFIMDVDASVDKVDKKEEAVKHPSHYRTKSGLECIKVMREVFGDEAVDTFAKLNAFKYLWRSGKKPGEDAEKDVKKAAFYLSMLDGTSPKEVRSTVMGTNDILLLRK